jgi:DNA-binding transcriptional LysR family regulator
MDLGKLKAFVVVAEELNFRRSAEILGMSQPPLSRLIAGLEDELSTKLFVRNTRQVSLTGAGVHLLREARELLARAERVEREIRSVAKLRTGKLVIGFSATTFMANLPLILDGFRSRFPKVKLELEQESKQRIYKGLRAGQFDVGFAEGAAAGAELETHVVHDEKLGVLLPKNHALAKRKEIELEELKDETIIVHPRKESEQFFATIAPLFQRAGIEPRLYVKNERESCPILVAIGKGVVLTIANVQPIAGRETRFVPLKRLSLPVSALWRADNTNPSLQCFLSFVMESDALGKSDAEYVLDGIRR